MAGKQAAPSGSALEGAFRCDRLGIPLLLAEAKVATGQDAQEGDLDQEQGHAVPLCAVRGDPVPGPRAAGLRADRPVLHPESDLGQQLRGVPGPAGFDVYLLDWGIPGHDDRALSFDDYVLDYLARRPGVR